MDRRIGIPGSGMHWAHRLADYPYDASRDALFRPQLKPVFVGREHMPPFDPHAVEFTASNGWWMSSAAHLAYYEEGPIAAVLERIGWRLVRFFKNHSLHACEQSTEGFLADAGSFAVLAFRGTDSTCYADLKRDVDFRMVRMAERATARVHRGFQTALDEVWDDVASALDSETVGGVPVWYTGHSLGAALATLAAVRRPPAGLITFGSPRVGNGAFAQSLAGFPVHRLINCCDFVAAVPPGTIQYRHAGDLLFLTGRGALHSRAGFAARVAHRLQAGLHYHRRFPWFRKGAVWLRSLADHSIVNYSHALAARAAADGR